MPTKSRRYSADPSYRLSLVTTKLHDSKRALGTGALMWWLLPSCLRLAPASMGTRLDGVWRTV
jgi:hypothetical protein